MVIMKQGLEDVSMLLFCLGPALQRTQSYASCNFNSSKSNMWHMVSITQLRLSNRYPYKNSCIPPAYACCQISGPIVAQLVGKCHCSPQRLEEGCHTLYRSVCLAYPDRTNSSLLGMLAQPSARPQQAQQLFHGMNAHTLSPISSGSLPLSFHVPFMLFILLSCIVSLFWFFSAGLFVGVFLRRLFVPLFLYFAQILPLCLSSFSTELQCLQMLVISKNYPCDCLFTNNCNLVHKNEPDYSNLNKYSP